MMSSSSEPETRLCARRCRRHRPERPCVLEKADEHLRGGNTYFTGGLFRFAYDGLEEVLALVDGSSQTETGPVDVGTYPASAFYHDVQRVCEGLSDPQLVQLLVDESYPTMARMRDQDLRWVLAYGRQAFEQDGKRRFWGGLVLEAVGGGKGLSDSLFELVERAGVPVFYRTEATGLLTGQGRGRGGRLRA